ncbi:MAG: hypothetical protein H6Q89_1759, partial [Myxococcaceae bacterium]|nr:hypothetical protein [Myxococcaceae bacterium]
TAGGAGGGTAGGAGGGTAGGAGGGTAGGAGGGTAGGAGGGTAAATCAAYCTTIQANCQAVTDGGTSNAQYPSAAACTGTCSAFSQGDAGTTAGNSLECRAYHATASTANLALHCPHAGPAGDGVCGSNCESFCAIALAKCSGTFNSAGACMSACNNFTGSGGRYNSSASTGNTFNCRMYHLSVAASSTANATTHCPHIVTNSATCI